MSDLPLRVHIPGFLKAVGTYELVKVHRGTLLSEKSESYAPVKRFVQANGLVLDESTTEADDTMQGGKAVVSWFMTPQNRQLQMLGRSAA